MGMPRISCLLFSRLNQPHSSSGALHVKTERSDIKKNDDDVFDAKPSSAQAKTGSSAHKPKKYPVVLNQKYTDRRWSAL